jgi:hypothetical protein
MTVCPLNKFIGILVLTLGFGVALWGSDAKPPCTVALESVRTPTGKSGSYLKAQIFKALVVDRPILFKSRFFAAAFEVALLKAQYLKVVGYDNIFEDSSFWSIQFNKNAHRQVFENVTTLKSVLNPIKSHELGKYEFSKHIVETLFAFRKSRGIDESVPERAATVSSLAQSFNFQSVDLLEETLALLKQIEVDPEATAAVIELVQVNLAEYIDFYFKQVAFNNYNSIFDNRSWEIQSEIKWGRKVVAGSTLGLGAGAAIPFLSTLGLIAPSANNGNTVAACNPDATAAENTGSVEITFTPAIR